MANDHAENETAKTAENNESNLDHTLKQYDHTQIEYIAELEAKLKLATNALNKIAEAERMGYGTQSTYGQMAQAAIEQLKGDK